MPIVRELNDLIESDPAAAWIALLASFAVLAKCASIFVDSAVALAKRFRVPKLVIGIVLVSLATTTPELSVSVTAALRGNPEMALGNAIGSVVCNSGVALPAAGLLAAAPISVIPAVFRSSGLFLIGLQGLAFVFLAGDYTLSRWEGAVLVALFAGYMIALVLGHRRGSLETAAAEETGRAEMLSAPGMCLLFLIGLGGIVLASAFIVTSASAIALSFEIPRSVIALTVVALGTSIPEFATCITAARKGHGALAVGNIIGANIMNICWVSGASAIANDLSITGRELAFMFPAMFVMAGAMLIALRTGYSLTKAKSAFLVALYAAYLACSAAIFQPPA